MALNRPGPPDIFVEMGTDALVRPGDVGVLHSEGWRIKPHEVPPCDHKAWQDYLAKWDIQMPFRIHLTAETNGHMVFMKMHAVVPDARSSRAGIIAKNIILEVEVLVPTTKPDERTERWVRALLRWLVTHELDEWIEVDGVRVFDPHRDGRTPTPENS